METPIDSGFNELNSNALTINSQSVAYLREIGKWSKFLSIVGFVFVGLMIVFGLFAEAIFASLGAAAGVPVGISGILGIIYIGFAVVWFFPCLYLFQFSSKVKEAIRSNDPGLLSNALGNLKSHYKFIGIFTAIMMGIYGLIFVIALLFGMMAGR